MLKNLVILFLVMFGIFSPYPMVNSWAEESLTCPAPRGWYADPEARERWGGPDPTSGYRKDNDSIRITHYGLKDSQFQTPDEYIAWLKKILGQSLLGEKPALEEISEIKIAEKKATLLRYQYEYEGFVDHHGARIPHEFVYEEFVVIPTENGFWSLVLSNHSRLPFSFVPLDPKTLETKRPKLKALRKTWKNFLKSCQF